MSALLLLCQTVKVYRVCVYEGVTYACASIEARPSPIAVQKLQRATTLVTQQGTKQLQQMTLTLHQMLTNVKLEELLTLQQCSETGVDLRHTTSCLFFKLCIRLSKWFYRLALSRKPLVPKLYDVTEDEACLRRPFKSPHPNATGFSHVNRMVKHRS